MNIFKKIKNYFSKDKFYALDDFEFKNPSLKFKILDDEILLDFTNYIDVNLNLSHNISDPKNNLKVNSSIRCDNINQLIKLIRQAIEFDYKESIEESKTANWDFEYFLNSSFLNLETLCIYNRLFDKEKVTGDMIYPIVSIRKIDSLFYYWSHLDGFKTIC